MDKNNNSMAEPVTRHAVIPVEGTLLLCGIDTIDFGVYIDWAANEDADWAGLMHYLDKAKSEAQQSGGYVDTLGEGRNFIVRPSGKQPNYRYHVQFTEYHLFIAVTKEPKYAPNAYVSLNSETIWSRGPQGAVDLVCSDIKKLGGVVRKILLSRCDICVDFKMTSGLTEEFLKTHSITRSHKITYYTNCGCLETCYVGSKGAPILLRCYDKGKEIVVSNKAWFKGLWGIDDIDNVWRIEFQLRRSALKQLGLNSIDDLKNRASGVWLYLTDEWYSLRLPDNDRQNRRALHPFWKSVQNCAESFGLLVDVQRNCLTKELPSRMWFASRYYSLLVSMASVYGFADADRCVNYLFSITNDFIEKNNKDFADEVLKRSIKMGTDSYIVGDRDEHE